MESRRKSNGSFVDHVSSSKREGCSTDQMEQKLQTDYMAYEQQKALLADSVRQQKEQELMMAQQQLQQMAQGGQLTKDTHVWKQGMANWELAGNVQELNSLFGAVPPPPPPAP